MIIHVDMDAFYASVEERENPLLKGKPLIVAGRAEARGVVSAANYPARKFGVHSAMPTATALKRCPELIVIPPRHDLYKEISGQIQEIFYRYTPVIEPLALDEAFLDCQGSEKLYMGPEFIGRRIKQDILTELGLVASVGVATNKFLAKLATDRGKPDGFTVVNKEDVQAFLDPLPVGNIWGIGKVGNDRLHRHGIKTIQDLRRVDKKVLSQWFGRLGCRFWELARGIDDRRVTPDSEVKSISQETTFDQDVSEFSVLESTAMYLTESVCYRLRKANLDGRTVTVKIRFQDFQTITRSRSIDGSTHSTDKVWKNVAQLLLAALGGKAFLVRLLGVGVSEFREDGPHQTSLFADDGAPGLDEQRSETLDEVSDRIRERFGRGVIHRGKALGRKS